MGAGVGAPRVTWRGGKWVPNPKAPPYISPTAGVVVGGSSGASGDDMEAGSVPEWGAEEMTDLAYITKNPAQFGTPYSGGPVSSTTFFQRVATTLGTGKTVVQVEKKWREMLDGTSRAISY